MPVRLVALLLLLINIDFVLKFSKYFLKIIKFDYFLIASHEAFFTIKFGLSCNLKKVQG